MRLVRGVFSLICLALVIGCEAPGRPAREAPASPGAAVALPELRFYALESCMACTVITAMLHELESGYTGRMRFRDVTISSDAVRRELKALGLETHGLVGLSATGDVKLRLEGHEFGVPEMRKAAEELLESGRKANQ